MILNKRPEATEHWLTMSDGAKIRLRRFEKSGATRLLIGHGNGLAVDGYRVFWEKLLEGYEVILFDARNHGTSGVTTPDNHDWQHIADDIRSIVHALPRLFDNRTTFAVLHSMTAASAVVAATRESLPLNGMVLFDPPVQRPWAGVDFPLLRKTMDSLVRLTSGRARRFDSVDHLAKNMQRSITLTGWVPQSYRDVAEASVAKDDEGVRLIYPPELEARIFGNNVDFFTAWEPGELQVPALVVAGDPGDATHGMTSQCAACFADEMNIELKIMPEYNHFMQLMAPQTCVAVVEEFIAKQL